MQDSPIAFGLDAGQPFDARCLSWRLPDELGRQAAVSIWTIAGRMKNVRILGDPKQLIVLCTRSIGETDLIRRDGRWLLHVTVETPQAPLAQPRNGFVDVDLGIVDIATTSDGARVAGDRLNRYRKWQLGLRKGLQAKKTSSTRRLLKKRRRKDARFATDVNHQISQRIVAEAERTGRGIAVEDLGGIGALHGPFHFGTEVGDGDDDQAGFPGVELFAQLLRP